MVVFDVVVLVVVVYVVDVFFMVIFVVVVTMSQVAPSWCLLSSTFQFGSGIPKSLIPPAFLRPVQQHHNSIHDCGIKHTISCQTISSNIYPFPSVSNKFSAISSHFQ